MILPHASRKSGHLCDSSSGVSYWMRVRDLPVFQLPMLLLPLLYSPRLLLPVFQEPRIHQQYKDELNLHFKLFGMPVLAAV